MSNQDKSNHWRLLASEIGAETPPEPEATEPPPTVEPAGPVAEDSKSTSATKPERPHRSARPPRSRANWMELAEQLGVEVPETPEAASEESAAKATRPTATAPEEPNAAVEPPEWLDHGRELETLDEVVFPVSSPSAPRAAVPRGEDEGTEAAEAKLPRKRKKRRRRGRESKSAAEPAVREEMDEEAEMESVYPEIAEAADKEPADEGERDAESGGKASRRKRRGRGGRRRSTGAGKTSDDATKKRDEDDLDETARETRKRGSGRRLSEEEDEEDEDGASRKAAGFAHRGIPSWEEAVGIVIGINLESRAKRGPSEGSPRPRGGRGRRGRDKGKGSSK
ncbi:MAG: hypothetical protein JW719_11450 [Pirellulales bacterium]|nr:hypothetical protein [Pirellulales bacterium]